MKRILSIVIALCSILVFTQSAYAGYSSNTRSKCRWYAKKYAVNCHLATRRCGISYSGAHNGECDFAYRHIDRLWGCSCTNTSQAHSQNGGGGAWGYLNLYCGTSGGALNELLADAGIMDAGDPGTEEPGADGTTQEQMLQPSYGYAEHAILLRGIRIRLTSPAGSTAANTLSTNVWVPQDDTIRGVEDTIVTAAKTISGGTVSLVGGELRITGSLYKASDFMMEKTPTGISAVYVGGDKSVMVPAFLDIDGVAINTQGDVVTEADGAMSKLVQAGEGSTTLNLMPNPASDVLQVSIREAAATSATVGIYDINGKRISTENIAIANGTADLKIDIATLPAGTYFVMVKGAELQIVKQFTKQ